MCLIELLYELFFYVYIARTRWKGANLKLSASGETVLMSEFASHSDLHLAEGIALKEAEEMDSSTDTTILTKDHSSFMEIGSMTPTYTSGKKSTSPGSRSSISSGSTLRTRNTSQKHPYSIKDWANVLLGSTTPLRPKTATTRKRRNARRLGVRVCIAALSSAFADFLRVRNRI